MYSTTPFLYCKNWGGAEYSVKSTLDIFTNFYLFYYVTHRNANLIEKMGYKKKRL